ncbi:MAG: lipid-A-disaccharide synthase [Gammaproteobacteria bacterium]|nr:lipid-A-disaccharide synthase [Gammaproteobacteria bacterium]
MRIGMVAGEASGDILGGDLLAALNTRDHIVARGIAGPEMVAAGCDALYPADRLSVMGLAEVLKHLPDLLKVRRVLRENLLEWQPDVFVGIDAPDFNLGVEKWLKLRGVKTVHYVSPSVWAWRAGRAAKIGESADRVLTLFPFEPEIYARYSVDAVFVGHPLADRIPDTVDPKPMRAELALDVGAPVLAILPGSRMSEVSRLVTPFLQAAGWLQQRIPDLQCVIPLAGPHLREPIEKARDSVAPDLPLRLVDGRSRDAMAAADVVLLASGTAALEAMLLKKPMVVSYRLAALTYAIVKTFRLLKVEHVSLPNVLAGRPLVPELMQDRSAPEYLGPALLELFESDEARARQIEPFQQLHEVLRCDASARAAEAVLEVARRN